MHDSNYITTDNHLTNILNNNAIIPSVFTAIAETSKPVDLERSCITKTIQLHTTQMSMPKQNHSVFELEKKIGHFECKA